MRYANSRQNGGVDRHLSIIENGGELKKEAWKTASLSASMPRRRHSFMKNEVTKFFSKRSPIILSIWKIQVYCE